MTMPTVENILSMYIWGSKVFPGKDKIADEKYIRAKDATTSIELDAYSVYNNEFRKIY